MRNFIKLMTVAFMAVIVLAACGGGDADSESNEEDATEETASGETLKVVTTFTLLEDIVKQIGGDTVETFNLVPIGTDPHEYEPLPEDMGETEDADVLFFNGLNLEGGDSGWFAKLIEATDQDEDNVYEVAEGVDPMYLGEDSDDEKEVNPHSFLDPQVGMIMAENVKDALIEISPENKEAIEENAEEYHATLVEMDEEYETRINDVPEEDRILVTSERAYQYMADRYGLKEGFIWEIDTEENGTPDQITTLVNFVKDEQPPVLFVESNVDTRPMETVSSESDVEIFEDKLYSDEIGVDGEEDTYVKFLQYNIDKIHDGLKGE